MPEYQFHWLVGIDEYSEGSSVADAFAKLGYGAGAMSALDYYKELKGETIMDEDRVMKTCKTCKKPFSISQGELDWLEKKGLAPFEHCSECRKKRRDAATAIHVEEAIANGK